jgi:hypothetical protein
MKREQRQQQKNGGNWGRNIWHTPAVSRFMDLRLTHNVRYFGAAQKGDSFGVMILHAVHNLHNVISGSSLYSTIELNAFWQRRPLPSLVPQIKSLGSDDRRMEGEVYVPRELI